MLDKVEPPTVQDSYALALAMTGLQTVVGSISSLVDERVIKPAKIKSQSALAYAAVEMYLQFIVLPIYRWGQSDRKDTRRRIG